MTAAEPWWASDRHVHDDLDPVAAHRAARRAGPRPSFERVVAAVDPQVVEHLGRAADHLVAAARAFLAAGPDRGPVGDTAEPRPGDDGDGGVA